MNSSKSDRRITKSKRALTEALIQLMVEKGYEGTSVSDIAERADVGRSTFYAHYADKEDLLRESLDSLKRYLSEPEHASQPGLHPALGFSLPMLEHVNDVRPLFTAIVARRSTAKDLVHEMLVDLITERLSEEQTLAPTSIAPLAQQVVGSFVSLCTWWMSDAPHLAPADVHAEFVALAVPGLRGALQRLPAT